MQKKHLPLVRLTVGSVALAGCSSASPGGTSDDGITIVASTDVWGSIATAVGGDGVEVTSIIDSPDKDPHEYEATSRDQLAISRADLIVENGGGYDSFIDTLIDASGSSAHVVSAVEASGLAPEGDHSAEAEDGHADEEHAGEEHAEDAHGDHGHIEGFNEHVFYDLATASAVAKSIADELSELDPSGADGYRERAAEFESGIDELTATIATVKEANAGQGVLITEPVPLYLLDAMGLKNLTPESFSEAVEEDSDVSPADLQTVLSLIQGGEARFLAYNEQASTSQTETVRAEADAAGVPVVDFTETLPAGTDYLGWMKSNIEAVTSVLGR